MPPIMSVDDLPELPELPGQHPVGYEMPPASETELREKIIHVLTIFPRLSHSMLQIGIGTYVKPAEWRPILEKLIDEGIVGKFQVQSQSPANRSQVYTVLTLNPQKSGAEASAGVIQSQMTASEPTDGDAKA